MRFHLPTLILTMVCAYFWIATYMFGFFIAVIWTIVIAAVVGLWIRLTGRG